MTPLALDAISRYPYRARDISVDWMHTDFVSRHLLPQELSMQSFAFAPPNLGVGDNKKSESDKLFSIDGCSLVNANKS